MDAAHIPITLAIVAITSVVTIAAFRNMSLYYRLMLNIQLAIHDGEWWRIGTSALVHADWPHLLFNMFALYSFGSLMESNMLGWQYLMIYVVSVVAGSFAAVIVHRNNRAYNAVGASGGVYGIMGAATIAFPELPMRFMFFPFGIPAWVMCILLLLYSVFAARRGGDNIGHEAHIGGMYAGMLALLAFYPFLVAENALYVAILFIAGIASWVAIRRIPR